MKKETKKERFLRLSSGRLQKIVEMLHLLGNCSNKNNYDYSDEEVNSIFDTLEEEIANAKSRFVSRGGSLKSNFRNVFESEYTWLNGFMRNVYKFADKEAMFMPATEKSWTYGELNKEANKFANALSSDGVKHGDVVMYQLFNCPEFVFAYVATHKLGAVSCPMNFRLSSGEIALTIEDSMPSVFMYDASMDMVVSEALTMSKHKPNKVVVVNAPDNFVGDGYKVSYSEYIDGVDDTNPIPDKPLNIYDETTRLYTSGTTGRQKGVPLTSINEVLSAHDVMMHFPLSYTDKTMNTTPWFHRGGIHSGGLTPTLYAGGTIMILPKFDAKRCLEYTEKYNITFLIGVPTVLEQLAFEQERAGRDLSSLNGIVTMGSALERAACIKYQKLLTPNIFNGYGTTETFWNTFLRPGDLPEMAGTAGRSCTDDEVRVVKVYEDRKAEPDDEAAHDDTEVGEIIIKSPAKSAYMYYNNPEETERKFYKGYYYTNDLGTWDKKNFVSVVGRKDDMIISGGENIYPTQVEEVLNTHPKVSDCIVTSVPDKAYGELVTAYIVPKDKSLTVDELENFCRTSPMISKYKRPRYYRFVEEIPFNATGKKLHYKIKEIAKRDFMNGLLKHI
ncbi:MAG: AMP-binding protein [Clostridia bacterium]|nr:AMP-binding protein [Clostridia bacterium]